MSPIPGADSPTPSTVGPELAARIARAFPSDPPFTGVCPLPNSQTGALRDAIDEAFG